MRVLRLVSVAALAVACVTCAEQPLVRRAGYARIPLAPQFAIAPSGGPNINVTKIRGVLRGTTDSTITEALVAGDSAILEFEQVVVNGDSSKYTLGIQATDGNNIVVFTGEDTLQVKPGDNTAATPALDYAAPDLNAASVDISVTALALDWAGAKPGNTTCLNKVPNASSKTDSLLSVAGATAANLSVPNVRVGWTSRDTLAFVVNDSGRVTARCSNKSAYLVARTFLDKADSILVTVTAPAFSLKMSPDSTDVSRGSTVQMTAQVVDETGFTASASTVSWFSSDTTRAKVNASGLVTGVSNGRVLITASSNGRTTVGVVQVVRPLAARVIVQPTIALDSLGVGQSRQYFAKALDASNKVIPEATVFAWSSTAPAKASVDATTGLTTALSVGTASIVGSLDGKADTVDLSVLTQMPPGIIKGKVTDASTGAALAGVDVRRDASTFTTTAADGSFSIGGLQNGDSVVLSKPTSYVAAIAYNVPAFPNKTIEVPSVSLSPTGGTGAISGTVVNALSNATVSGITVKAYKGINSGPSPKRPLVTPDFTTTTNSSGIFTISAAPAGAYTLLFSATGYSDAISGANAVSGVTKTIANVLVAPTSAGGGIYIVLTWGSSADCTVASNNVPCNLDAHLTGPQLADTSLRFQVYSGSPRYVVGTDTIAALDVAASNGHGPEILSIRPSAPAPGFAERYHFYVHNATANTTPSNALADSASARVDVYQDGHLIGTFFPPTAASGTVWNVFDYDGARLLPVGTITSPADPTTLSIRAPDEKKRRQ